MCRYRVKNNNYYFPYPEDFFNNEMFPRRFPSRDDFYLKYFSYIQYNLLCARRGLLFYGFLSGFPSIIDVSRALLSSSHSPLLFRKSSSVLTYFRLFCGTLLRPTLVPSRRIATPFVEAIFRTLLFFINQLYVLSTCSIQAKTIVHQVFFFLPTFYLEEIPSFYLFPIGQVYSHRIHVSVSPRL